MFHGCASWRSPGAAWQASGRCLGGAWPAPGPFPGAHLFVFFDLRENLEGKYGGRFFAGDSDIKGIWPRIYLIHDFVFAALTWPSLPSPVTIAEKVRKVAEKNR